MKRFISLFLVFSVLALSVPLTSKERKGADLIIQKSDGTYVRGELIAVKENSLLLVDKDTELDITVDVEDIREITHMKKSKAGTGFLIGCAFGALVGAITYSKPVREGWFTIDFGVGGSAIGAGILGGLAGLVIGVASGKDKTIQIEGKSNSAIKQILRDLRTKARVKNAQ